MKNFAGPEGQLWAVSGLGELSALPLYLTLTPEPGGRRVRRRPAAKRPGACAGGGCVCGAGAAGETSNHATQRYTLHTRRAVVACLAVPALRAPSGHAQHTQHQIIKQIKIWFEQPDSDESEGEDEDEDEE